MFISPAYAQTAPDEGATHTETGTAHEGASGVFPPFDSQTYPSQILWLVITFGLFYVLMQKVIAPRIGSILEQRHDRIAQDIDEAGRLKAEADAAVETYEKELAEARAKAGEIAAAARDDAKAKADAERAAVEADLTAKVAAAEAGIVEIKTKALAEVGTIAEETASAIVERLIGTPVSEGELKAAVSAAKEA
ncbi:F0F1 ATP synthase subunit B [Rhizobiaceae bacterium BDR2-2]|uniref:ATP synthase subunit b n=1 Tax=Ectorhizobium quercum TaxID=2965071 RepID=A0AAE3N503_9HYPH|nr:F0F1 ATP synthase subunit B [Ectorhizobium quercum]MCX8996319.1 F0F1 ATP synthase subunit B [Ectorhizobium quercum]MCX8998642.1 F0F1 ATP synthase subunit B [Ectorhizobium quercum]